MQLKGLVRFFTILLILYSIYQLSFTWIVRGHENKLEAKAMSDLKKAYPDARKYANANDLPDSLETFYSDRLRRLQDSTKDVTLTYGPTGAISYKKAKESELNLGLDLQGGMSVTMEVELVGLLKTMSNDSKDPVFLKALENANLRKANSSGDFVTLFVEEYKKLNPNGKLAPLFAAANPDKININDADSKVVAALRSAARDAFDNTFRVLRARIDQFGVAQPNINPDKDRGIITVELPGIKDQERVRKYLQASANLQFWEVYELNDPAFAPSIGKAIQTFSVIMNGKSDTAAAKPDSGAVAKTPIDTAKKIDTTGPLSKIINNKNTVDTAKTPTADTKDKQSLLQYVFFSVDQQGQPLGTPYIANVRTRDSGQVRKYLEMPAIARVFPSDVAWMYGKPEMDKNGKESEVVPLYAIRTYGRGKAPLEGDVISTANEDYDPTTSKPIVSMKMTTTGTRIWADMTTKAYKNKTPIAIVLDNIVYSAPGVHDGPITGGVSQISGSFTIEEAKDLANILRAGKLPAPAKIVQEQVVGPTLGSKAIHGGMLAFVISFIIIFALMLIYYNTSGWIANIALILNLVFTIGVLTGLGATLTAPGIAGLVLTIGMAVDTNVIIYERIKEELSRGKGYIPAVNEGYRRSLPPVLDAHVTTLLTAIILFSFGLGPVKGFATTQIIGILLSLFCGILVSRWVTDWFTNKKRHLEYFTGVSRRIFKHANFKFIEYRKYAYGISAIVLALGIGSFFHGFDEGVEFKGGRSFQVRFADNITSQVFEKIRDDLKVTFGEAPVIKTIGDAKTLDITTSYLINETNASKADSMVEQKLYVGLKPVLPANLSFGDFDKKYKMGSKKVLPTISDDLKNGAKKATLFSLLIIALYIFIRFRDWRYSLGTIIALLHDVLVTLAVFSFARSIVPFPLEIDQHFIAAILTVIGFSMNDTVIVFDRIREYSRTLPIGTPKETVINRAINDTLSRTIMTSLTVFLTILILFLVGGEVTKGFAFAMLVGVITGTYSSIFVAAPVLVDLARRKPLGKSDATIQTQQKTTTTTRPTTMNS
jgi:SecD/SecF fusion protein